MAEQQPDQIALSRIKEARRTGATTLNLSGSGLTAVPESLGQLAGLQWLSLSNNQLTAVPESLGRLAELR